MMLKLRTIKNSYLKVKENYTHKITEEEALNEYMVRLIDEAEENLQNGETLYPLDKWREMMKLEYGIKLQG